jgi:hypothetical protein
VSSGEAIALVALLLGGAAQSATGFGFAVVAAPVLTAVYAPRQAVPTLAVVGICVSLLILIGEGHRPRPLPKTTATLIAASIPGTVIGALVLAAASTQLLRALVAVAVLGAVAARAVRPRRVVAAHTGETTIAGVLAGAFGATTGLNGPPLVLLMLRRAVAPDRSRDTLNAAFVVFDGLIIVTLAIGGTLDLVGATPLLLVVAAVGQVGGRSLRPAVAARQESVSLTLLGLSGAVALGSALGLLP